MVLRSTFNKAVRCFAHSAIPRGLSSPQIFAIIMTANMVSSDTAVPWACACHLSHKTSDTGPRHRKLVPLLCYTSFLPPSVSFHFQLLKEYPKKVFYLLL